MDTIGPCTCSGSNYVLIHIHMVMIRVPGAVNHRGIRAEGLFNNRDHSCLEDVNSSQNFAFQH